MTNSEQKQKTVRILHCCGNHAHADWFIGPVGVHRDSDTLDRANWQTVNDAYDKIDPEGDDHEVLRFGHWAVGWIEEVAYRPGSQCAALADEFRARLEDYPVLDEHLWSELEMEEEMDNAPGDSD